ncbi:MAG: iron-sulfur cluster assembly accessory protein [Chroococcus sp. CMT-3BRIN-NPC107]|jgi:iron-sulfur cluster assembly accessory protein|nr:iron-sulfur cluster assembly accessory protein [Chroococcus sp. CMT-3BRIN-NPC107]
MITISPTAIKEISRLKSKVANPEALFRLQVQPGGCSGWIYQLNFDKPTPSDRLYESNGISIVVDSESVKHLNGLTLDYSEDLMGGAFRFHNPNALTFCGCGNSFTTA